MKIIKFGDHDGHHDRHPMTLRQAMQRMFDESFWDPFGMLGDTFPRRDIEIDVHDNILTIHGSTHQDSEGKNGTIIISVPKKHADQHHVRKIPIES